MVKGSKYSKLGGFSSCLKAISKMEIEMGVKLRVPNTGHPHQERPKDKYDVWLYLCHVEDHI